MATYQDFIHVAIRGATFRTHNLRTHDKQIHDIEGAYMQVRTRCTSSPVVEGGTVAPVVDSRIAVWDSRIAS